MARPTGWTDDEVDLLGKPRLRKGAIDMGCYQVAKPYKTPCLMATQWRLGAKK